MITRTLAVLALSAAVGAPAIDTGRLTVRVRNARNDTGRVIVAVYDSPDGFPGGANAVRSVALPLERGQATATFDGLARGTYAVAVVHDENANGRLDTRWVGIPREGIAASNGAQGRFGPARFEDAKFTVAGDTAIQIELVYVGF